LRVPGAKTGRCRLTHEMLASRLSASARPSDPEAVTLAITDDPVLQSLAESRANPSETTTIRHAVIEAKDNGFIVSGDSGAEPVTLHVVGAPFTIDRLVKALY